MVLREILHRPGLFLRNRTKVVVRVSKLNIIYSIYVKMILLVGDIVINTKALNIRSISIG